MISSATTVLPARCQRLWLAAVVLGLLLAFVSLPAAAAAARSIDASSLQQLLDQVPEVGPIHALLISRDGRTLLERAFDGPGLDQPANIKSLSKTIQSALVGIAIERGLIDDPDQPIMALLDGQVPAGVDARLEAVTVDHLLSMRAGLASTSGANYGRWVMSDDWIDFALSRPFVGAPGERMQYSTGVWHLLSAILTWQSGESTLALARRWLGEPLGVVIPEWPRDPRGIYFGGNDMHMAPRDLLAFGELYLNGGQRNGSAIIPPEWVELSWTQRSRSPWSGHGYGYGWYITTLGGERVYYGRGFGGQLLYVVPDLGIVVVITSRSTPPSAGRGYVRSLHRQVEKHVIRGARACDERPAEMLCASP